MRTKDNAPSCPVESLAPVDERPDSRMVESGNTLHKPIRFYSLAEDRNRSQKTIRPRVAFPHPFSVAILMERNSYPI